MDQVLPCCTTPPPHIAESRKSGPHGSGSRPLRAGQLLGSNRALEGGWDLGRLGSRSKGLFLPHGKDPVPMQTMREFARHLAYPLQSSTRGMPARRHTSSPFELRPTSLSVQPSALVPKQATASHPPTHSLQPFADLGYCKPTNALVMASGESSATSPPT